jgi:hypothetical protein
MRVPLLCLLLVVGLLLSGAAEEQASTGAYQRDEPVPELARLAKLLVGDWNTRERMERGSFFLKGVRVAELFMPHCLLVAQRWSTECTPTVRLGNWTACL